MRTRKQALGNRNMIGARVAYVRNNKNIKQKELLAQLQIRGIDMNPSALSKLEGQVRLVTDYELLALSEILNVSIEYLLGLED
jgi:transcriptional regulator with XRE-family HTH domain